ncbi:hypothetical protein VNO77_34200 [Canavalia gladiata]|uniref:Uncharacterized protein n=1 Tax=Canavalia gladiata TaxID=3824 RepID=A0AAN9PZK8_CANGL
MLALGSSSTLDSYSCEFLFGDSLCWLSLDVASCDLIEIFSKMKNRTKILKMFFRGLSGTKNGAESSSLMAEKVEKI